MPYNEYLAERIERILKDQKVKYYAKKMFSGLCFMVEDKMCCGIHIDKHTGIDLLMARIGEKSYETAIKKEGAKPMDFTGRPMKGYIFVTQEGFDTEDDLESWIQLCLDFNPLAKASKKRKTNS